MMEFFEFMFRDGVTAWGMSIFLLLALWIVVSGFAHAFKKDTER